MYLFVRLARTKEMAKVCIENGSISSNAHNLKWYVSNNNDRTKMEDPTNQPVEPASENTMQNPGQNL